MKKSLQILATPMNSHGHINAVHGLADRLRSRGHRVIFVLQTEFKGKMSRYGYEERILDDVVHPHLCKYVEEGKEFWQTYMASNGHRFEKSPVQMFADVLPEIFDILHKNQLALHDQYRRLIEEIQPDLILNDCVVDLPPVTTSSIPWVWVFSASPQFMLMDSRIPPYYSGLPLDGDKEEWKHFSEKALEGFGPLMESIRVEHVKQGGKAFGNRLHPFSPFLNIYMTPEVMRYDILSSLPENILGVNELVRSVPDQTFPIPKCLVGKPGKLIYFSMGSFGCANLTLMSRLLRFMARLPHRFIVVKGPHEYELPGENMYGEAFLPQPAVLSQVDMVITHGGNNTVTETFFYGKKMLILPTYFDQLDNAQRIQEVGLGLRLNPFTCTEVELADAVNRLANDEQLTERMRKIGEQIRGSDDKEKVVDYIENKLCN